MNVDFHGVKEIFRQVDLGLLGLAIALVPLFVCIRAWRWRSILVGLNVPVPFWDALRICALGFSLGLATPAQVGDLSRGYYLKQLGHPAGRAVASVIYDRVLDLITYGVFGAIGLLVWRPMSFPLFTSLGVVLSVAIVLVSLGRAQKVQTAFAALLRIAERFLGRHIHFPVPGKRVLWAAGAKTLLVVMGQIAATVLLAKSIGVHLPFLQLVIILTVAALIQVLPISVAGIGTRDAFLVHALAPYGIESATAIGCSTLLLAYVLFIALMGLIFYVASSQHHSKEELK